jgi:hypothetical protein
MNKRAALVIPAVMVSPGVFAALPTAATDALTTVQTDGLALIAAAWPVVAALVGGMILIGLFKKVAKRAAG